MGYVLQTLLLILWAGQAMGAATTPASSGASSDPTANTRAFQTACGDNIRTHCSDMAPGKGYTGRLIDCLKGKMGNLSAACRTRVHNLTAPPVINTGTGEDTHGTGGVTLPTGMGGGP